MATNPPAQQQEEVILVRDSAEHQEYLKHQFGAIKSWVNAFETRIAVAGRAMLLIYVIYITVIAGAGAALPRNLPWLNALLIILDILMLALQVLGLEGSVPGLTHLADDLEGQGKEKESNSVRRAAGTAQVLIAATAIDVVLQYSPHVFKVSGMSIDISGLAFGYDKLLFIVRLIVIGQYLKAMARLENKGPKVISKHEHEKQAAEKEQKQIRIDNANIKDVVNQALLQWASTQPNFDTMFTDSIHQLESVVAQKIDSIQAAQNERISALSRSLEAAQFGSNSGSTNGSMIDTESLMLQVNALLGRSNSELVKSLESKIIEVSRQVSRVESVTTNQISNLRMENAKALSEAEARSNEALRKVAVETKASAIQKNTVKEPVKPRQAQITDITEAREERQAGLSVEELKLLFESDESLLELSGSALSQKYGISKASANRAKKEYVESHPESLNNLDSGELEAINS